MEEWKDYNEYLSVSSYGNVIAKDYYCFHKNRWGTITKQLRKGGLIKPYTNTDGYLQFNYMNKRYLIHILVAETFIPNPDKLPIVNHKDENRTNNHTENLEWCSNEYNLKYGTSRQRAAEHKSKQVYQYTLDGKLVGVYSSIKETAKDGFNRSCVSLCCNKKIKKHKGYKWSFEPL